MDEDCLLFFVSKFCALSISESKLLSGTLMGRVKCTSLLAGMKLPYSKQTA